jgi:hypothetical protein
VLARFPGNSQRIQLRRCFWQSRIRNEHVLSRLRRSRAAANPLRAMPTTTIISASGWIN